MAKFFSTVWALLLNICGIFIFQTCFGNMEDEDGEFVPSGPMITSILFSLSVYILIMQFSLFPSSFKKPVEPVLVVYEFLTTAFFLEFALACIWIPLEVLMLTTLPNMLSRVFTCIDWKEGAHWLELNKSYISILSILASSGFLYFILYITKALDFTILRDYGVSEFVQYVSSRVWNRISAELPNFNDSEKACRLCKPRRRNNKCYNDDD